MKITILLTVLICLMMSSIAGAAVLEEDWAYDRRNVAPDGIEYAYWDFENGAGNLFPLNNQHSDVAVFLPVTVGNPGTIFETDEPSYVWDRGRAMHIYPWDHYWQDTARTIPVDFIYIVNGHYAFSPRTGPDMLGKYWPGRKAYVDFKEDTQYVSFLACTGGTLYVNLYDKRGNSLSSARIYANIDRVGSEPSEFTRFEVHLPDKEIGSMSLSGMFNGWQIDDLIVGGAPGYLGKRRDYSYAAERLKRLIGVPYNEFGLGYQLYMQEYLTAAEIKDDIPDPYWDKRNKDMVFGEGISDEAAIAWAFNDGGYGELVNWADITDQCNKDFTEEVVIEDLQPGDVFFIDRPEEDGFPDGFIDEVGMYVGDTEFGDVIRITPVIDGKSDVRYDTIEMIEIMYGEEGFVDYRCLPDNPTGGHAPYPKIPTKIWASIPYPPT